MFDPLPHPRIFALPPGADFPAELVAGLRERLSGPPESLARVDLFLNTSRMRRRVQDLFHAHTGLLPRLRLLGDLSGVLPPTDGPAPVSPLQRRLELARLVGLLIERDRSLAPRAAIFDLAESLAALMEEMQVEGVAPDALEALDVSDESGHWARSLRFISIVRQFFEQDAAPDPGRMLRQSVDRLIAHWQDNPPQHPVIVAGSTGSRGATADLMMAVARLPQGAVILPGFDFDQPDAVWDRLDDALSGEDHPQFRFARLMQRLDITPDKVQRWSDADPARARNRLVSLALRPAPVTDQWMTEGPNLGDLAPATRDMTLIEAATPRQEALAIALCLRDAAERGETAALITPDRMLTRQVAAALDRWSLIPDDSAGRPLALSAPGRFLRQVAGLFGTRLTAETLLALLKHPLSNSAGDRGPHLRLTREFELWQRRKGPAFPTGETIMGWAADRSAEDIAWAGWLAPLLAGLEFLGTDSLTVHLERLIALSEALAGGPEGGSGELWLKEAGNEAAKKIAELRAVADTGGDMGTADFRMLLQGVLDTGEVREPVQSHPGVMIWGTLEARVQGADLVILGGLNDGIWPQLPAPDPWLNRRMRQQAGLLLPERRVGLSAHDFQQAIGAKTVILTRATRDAEAETVVSRWLNRLSNLLSGLPGIGGPEALAAMRAKGQGWLDLARAIEADFETVSPAPRPAPRPPVEARPTQLSVTQIKTLIRDPYAIYARHILRLRPLDPLHQMPDAPLRGTVVHAIFERFVAEVPDPTAPDARARLLALTETVLAEEVPWPTARRMWAARLARVADWFLDGEATRRIEATPLALEGSGAFAVPGTAFTLTGKADRIDRRTDGRLVIYDYKTGTPPKPPEMEYFDKQLLLEAAMAEAGAVKGVPRAAVAEVAYIGLGSTPVFTLLPLRDHEAEEPLDPDETIAGLRRLLAAFDRRTQGYSSRRAMHKTWNDGDYDHLARFGEWDESQPPMPEDVG
ncbi:double-strand break repair protein AddB [Oceaniovalibus sp. ACAM 378]|uniref:double-strand break repair protein AddB n=1 Tax=Oceaniovalibus sp. ACAM 378 TaxID=2599923 RepID=UPI0011D9185F|nr:double-strand break repair protein AddB [Oceaniovalibus sp. ACAM 378]TYB86447.1 double-strand break repair protein AddB [Oceaniovalibus sp. ACAM 378]